MTAQSDDPLHPAQLLRQVIAHLETQRSLLGDTAVDAAAASLRQKLAELEPAPADLAPTERKLVTILFADISGFTALSETLDPEAVRDLINACFEALVPPIEKYGGVVDKFIGDEVMALFGAPLAHENDPERALRAVLEMKDALADFNACRGANLGIHFGVNTGLVIAGGIGTKQRQEYSVIGDAVNLAARLADLSQGGQALVGEETYRLSAPLFDFQPLPPVMLKGKRQPQAVYELSGLRARPGQVRGLEPLGLNAPLVGRAAEFEALLEALHRLEETTDNRPATGDQRLPAMVVILGEAGVGKSRLIAEARRRVDLPWFEGRCLSYGEMLSYHPFLSLLRSLMGATPDDGPEALQIHLHALLEELLPHRRDETYPYLADLLGLPLDAPTRQRLDSMSGESRRWQVFQVFEHLLLAQAQHAPTVIFLEDMHWADPTSVALLEQLLPLSVKAPLLFLIATRPHHGLFAAQVLPAVPHRHALVCQAISLAPLSTQDSRQLVEHLLAVEALDAPIRELILSRAEGNPLYLEEILRSLISQGQLIRQPEGQWRVAPGVHIEQIYIPATLQGVIQARLDRLESAERSVLQIASVIGRIFWYRVLDEILLEEDGRGAALASPISERLGHLEQIELIRLTRQHPDLEYIFKHVLVQEAAYHTLLRQQRRIFHLRVAEALEKLYADAPEEQYGLIAYHYEAASQIDPANNPRAVHYLRLAGRRAQRAYALSEAEDYYRRALALIPAQDDDNRRQTLFDLGLVKLTQGDFGQAGEYYAGAFRLRGARPQTETRFARSPLRRAQFDTLTSIEPGMSLANEAMALLRELFTGLVDYDHETNLVPAMAESWQVDAQGLRYTFYLRPDAVWSDGEPLKAQDFIYAWRRLLHPDNHYESANFFSAVRGARPYFQGETHDPETIGVRALDEHTLEIELEQPLAYFLSLLALPAFLPLPAHAWPPPRPYREDPQCVVVNGPFRLVEWHKDDLGAERLALEANLRYCGERSGNLWHVEYRLAVSQEDIVTLVKNGEIDLVLALPSILSMPEDERLLVHRESIPGVFYAWLNAGAAPLDNLYLRQAICLAADRPGIHLSLQEFRGDKLRVARGGWLPPGVPGHTPELWQPYDPSQVESLLRQAGFGSFEDVPPLKLLAGSNIDMDPIYLALLDNWRRAGLRIESQIVSLSDLAQINSPIPPDIVLIGWTSDYLDPHNFFGDAIHVFRNQLPADYWQAVEEASHIRDVPQRMALYHALDRQVVVERAWCIPLSYLTFVPLTGPRLRRLPLCTNLGVSLSKVVLEEDATSEGA